MESAEIAVGEGQLGNSILLPVCYAGSQAVIGPPHQDFKGNPVMPSLKCPRCGASDLHAVNVETLALRPDASPLVDVAEKTELACKRCGWTPSAEEQSATVLHVKPADSNI